MPAQLAVTIVDEVPGRGRHVAFKLELWSEKVTARELIERRIRHEVDVYNENPPDTFLGLVQPTGTERALNGWRVKNATKDQRRGTGRERLGGVQPRADSSVGRRPAG